jgi:cell division protein FtsI/penicillin-binding protein 2
VPEIGSVGSINPATLAAVRAGLRQAVSDPQGTAHATVKLSDITVAGKTGTAETGGDRPPHAWLAGYAPAEAPRLAFVVVLEHAGGGSSSAGPVVRRLVTAMDQLQLLGRRRANVAADKPATRPM